MKFIWSIIPLTAVFTSVSSILLRYNSTYDYSDLIPRPVDGVTCSNKLKSEGYNYFNEIPSRPNFGGAYFISKDNTAACSACRKFTYTNSDKTTTSVFFTVIDSADEGFTASKQTMQTLQASQAPEDFFLNEIDISEMPVDESNCGITS
ncbi:hypothetical protein DFH94DRAFT_199129 [Russula ochroleuca]|jgi:hypothetical protein|uniref:Uncharacterized protein n=1 Tax=Russula ochroleuca TaxID=152965 RepID=A0A9P5JZ76_9AGAM|nr:hypothetical protein DFH94DRAFT_199129 [Russula ochroleuca]